MIILSIISYFVVGLIFAAAAIEVKGKVFSSNKRDALFSFYLFFWPIAILLLIGFGIGVLIKKMFLGE